MNSNEKGRFFSEVLGERNRQDEQWGGPEHDDAHSVYDWYEIIGEHVDRIWQLEGVRPGNYEEQLVKIGALAMAAWESHRRKRAAVDTATEEGSPT